MCKYRPDGRRGLHGVLQRTSRANTSPTICSAWSSRARPRWKAAAAEILAPAIRLCAPGWTPAKPRPTTSLRHTCPSMFFFLCFFFSFLFFFFFLGQNNNYLADRGASARPDGRGRLDRAALLHSVPGIPFVAVKPGWRLRSCVSRMSRSKSRSSPRTLRSERRVQRASSRCSSHQGGAEANILTVSRNVRKAFPDLKSQLPTSGTGEIVYDSTEFITHPNEVVKTGRNALVIGRRQSSSPRTCVRDQTP